MKLFHDRKFDKAAKALEDFMAEYSSERELVDRAGIYLALSNNRIKKESVSLNSFEDYYQNGVLKLNQGNTKEAIKSWKKALEKEPDSAKTHYVLADAYCIAGDKKQCLSHLEKAINQDRFFAVLAQNERDFEELEEDEDFQKLVSANE